MQSLYILTIIVFSLLIFILNINNKLLTACNYNVPSSKDNFINKELEHIYSVDKINGSNGEFVINIHIKFKRKYNDVKRFYKHCDTICM